MARLIEHFMPVFSFGLALDEKIAQSQATTPVVEVQAEARRLVEHARAAAQAAGQRPEHIEAAAFALVAWIDEIISRNPAYWNDASPLQVAMFNTNNAGNEFFYHLGNLKAGEDEVREVYYHALLLGFVGQYYFETGDTGELGKLKELHARQLPVAPAPTHVLREEQITPQPYLSKDPPGPRYPRQWDKLLLKAGMVVALLIPLCYLAWYFLTPAPQRGPNVQQLVDAQLRNYACSELSGIVDAEGAVVVSGFVSKPGEIEQVRRDVAAIDGVESGQYDIKVRIWPHCEVIALLKPYRERNLNQNMGLQVTPTTGHSDRFIEGERIIVQLVQAGYDGYLYVDYYTVEGQVVHLYPNPGEPDSGRVLRGGERFNVGESARTWSVGPPFGQELITVISSPTPLYQGERPEFEEARVYLPALRGLLDAQAANPRLAANFLILQTEPQATP
ncbi:MAG TPA: DotU family type IV/VI secretion system protein [Luteimonas sp.]